MASRSTPSTGTAPTKRKARTTQPQSFVARIVDADKPTLVIAKTQKLAHDAVVTLTLASAQDLLRAGREGWPVIDTTEALAPAKADMADERAAA